MTDDLLDALAEQVRSDRQATAPGLDGAPPEDGFPPPLGEAQRQRITDALLALPTSEAPSTPVVALRPRGRWAAAGGLLAAAAAAAIFLLPDDLPTYALTVSGGEAAVRSAPQAPSNDPIQLLPETELEITARPNQDVDGSVYVHGFVIADGHPVTPVVIDFERSASGAFHWAGPAKTLVGERRGPLTLVVVIAPDAELISNADLLRDPPKTWRVLKTSVIVKAPEP